MALRRQRQHVFQFWEEAVTALVLKSTVDDGDRVGEH